MNRDIIEKCLHKNQQFQTELLKTKIQIESMIQDRHQQLREILNVKETCSPYRALQLEHQAEKCSAYEALEIVHNSKKRRIYQESLRYYRQFNFEDDMDEVKSEQDQVPITNFEQLQKLKQSSLKLKIPEKRRFRQLKFERSNQPKFIPDVQQREHILNIIVDRLSLDGNSIKWHQLPKICTQIMGLNTSTQDKVGVIEVFRVWLRKQQRPINFSIEEDQKLTSLVQQYGENQWALLSKMVGTRSSIQLRERWFKSVNLQIKKKRWSLLEDLKLMMLVDYHTSAEWYKLSPFFANRTEVQLRERWCNVLLPSLERKSWTQEENDKLSKLKLIHGKAWSLICLQMEGRTDNECRRRWEQIERNESKTEEKKCEMDLQDESKSDDMKEQYIVKNEECIPEQNV